ncbi:MAG: VOC family protein [Actinomycetota bacterium]|nr:VOC family protein [Actinomycetota bacterium]
MDGCDAIGAVKLAGIHRGVTNAARSADFFGWLLGVVPEQTADGFSVACSNGQLLLHEDVSTPLGIELCASSKPFRGRDSDGVPVFAACDGEPAVASTPPAGCVALDHVRLNCADLPAAVDFYRRLGFVLTWSGCDEACVEGVHEEPMAGADWVHVSGSDGYVSLSQADWQDYGAHSTASGPPRFVHIGLAVRELASIAARLQSAGISCLRAPASPIGDRLYLNDPDGDSSLGTNVELTEYEPDAARSGKYATT